VDIEQYITYQHNVQRFFREHSEKYAGVIIPLSIATSFPTGTYGFIRALCSKHNHKYAIDPRTPLFQKSWDRKNVRPPHKKMAEIMGGAFETSGLNSKLEPSDFSGEAEQILITENCLTFQMNFKAREEDARKIKKYKELLGVSELDDLGDPQFLIPPYFLFNSVGDEWYEINTNCIRYAVEMELGTPIEPILHFNNWPDVKDWIPIIQTLKDSDIDAFWLYPDFYKEHEEDVDSLKAYRDIVERSISEKIKPYILFGGYYAVLMHYYGLCGFGNGIGYGEWRDSGYHRGDTAMTRVYILKLHRYLDAPEAQNIIDKDSEYFAEDTELLSECISTGRRLTDLTLVECLDHFMECRYAEMDFVANNPISRAKDELKETYEHLKKIGPEELTKYGTSLNKWWESLA
jgi:hypothetical protein